MEEKETQVIVADLKQQYKGYCLVQLTLPNNKDFFVCRLLNWEQYKPLVGSSESVASAFETIVTKCLVYPTVDYESFQNDAEKWSPGTIQGLGEAIQKAHGFSQGEVSIKKL